jgi:hypothetical protein
MFDGDSEYLEVLVSRVDAPLLIVLAITLFHQPIFDTPELAQIISRTPEFRTQDEASVIFSEWRVSVTLSWMNGEQFDGELMLGVAPEQSGWRLSSLAQVCSSSFPPALISSVEHLYIHEDEISDMHSSWKNAIESSQWLELFHLFPAVKELYLSREFALHVARVLQELVGERVTEVFPTLQTLFLDEPSRRVNKRIGHFVAARRRAGHPIAVSHWERE